MLTIQAILRIVKKIEIEANIEESQIVDEIYPAIYTSFPLHKYG